MPARDECWLATCPGSMRARTILGDFFFRFQIQLTVLRAQLRSTLPIEMCRLVVRLSRSCVKTAQFTARLYVSLVARDRVKVAQEASFLVCPRLVSIVNQLGPFRFRRLVSAGGRCSRFKKLSDGA